MLYTTSKDFLKNLSLVYLAYTHISVFFNVAAAELKVAEFCLISTVVVNV